jgi:hypothetical protein
MVDMIVYQRLYQRFLGVVDGVFDRPQLLGQLDAGPPVLNQVDDHPKMSVAVE